MSDNAFKVVGVDLAAQPGGTGCCVISVDLDDKNRRIATIGAARSGAQADDTNLLALFSEEKVVRVGIDAPFGWPAKFVKSLSGQCCRWPAPKEDCSNYPQNNSIIEYLPLKFRETDRYIWTELDKIKKGGYKVRTPPFSVSSDKIGALAMRTAGLLSQVRDSKDVDRSGQDGRFVEVYPAAAFARWDICTNGYKNDPWLVTKAKDPLWEASWKESQGYKRRRCMVKSMTRLDPLLMEDYLKTDHAVDALASALVTLMAEVDRCRPDPKGSLLEAVPPKCQALAKMEGWIALPKKGSLKELRNRITEWNWEPPASKR